MGREPRRDKHANKKLKVSQEPVSLDMSIGEGEDADLGDFVADRATADAIGFQQLREHVAELLPTLNERERRVLALRFALDEGNRSTLEEVCREAGVAEERI